MTAERRHGAPDTRPFWRRRERRTADRELPSPAELIAEIPMVRLDAAVDRMRKALDEFEEVRDQAHRKLRRDDP